MQKKKQPFYQISQISFGKIGGAFFSIFNIVQLIGFAAFFTALNADVLGGLSFQNKFFWCLLTGVFVLLWLWNRQETVIKIYYFLVPALAAAYILFYGFFTRQSITPYQSLTLTYSDGIELNVMMALFWLPVICDYTKFAQAPRRDTLTGILAYGLGGAALSFMGLKIASVMDMKSVLSMLADSPFKIPAICTVLFSTVTTVYLLLRSAGVNIAQFLPKQNENQATFWATGAGILLSLALPLNRLTVIAFLWVHAVFIPFFAIVYVDYFIIKRKEEKTWRFYSKNIILWALGYLLYRIVTQYSFFLGITLPVLFVMGMICYLSNVFSSY